MAKKKFVKDRNPGRRATDCVDCNKDQWNLALKFFTGGSFLFLVASFFWGWAAFASSEVDAQQNAEIKTLRQMLIDDRNDRKRQTEIIERIESLGHNRNLMIQSLALKLGVEVDLKE